MQLLQYYTICILYLFIRKIVLKFITVVGNEINCPKLCC